MLEAPAPGIHPDIPATDYHRWDAVSQSFLSRVREKSPKHARLWQLEPPEQTAAQSLGEAIHTAVLEPDRFDSYIVQGLDLDRRSNANKAAHAAFAEENEGKLILRAGEYEKVKAMRDSMAAHPRAMEILSAPDGLTELSLVWDDEETGVRCKGRIDRLCRWRDWNLVVDVKSTQDASKGAVSRAIARYLYDLQAAFYLDGAATIAPADRRFLFIFIESVAPFDIQIFEPNPTMLFEGRHKYQTALRRTAECLESGTWPGYGNEIVQIGLPKYAEVAEREVAEEEGWAA